jgi:hypothetical protein
MRQRKIINTSLICGRDMLHLSPVSFHDRDNVEYSKVVEAPATLRGNDE